jgi:uncharacterized protein YkwD
MNRTKIHNLFLGALLVSGGVIAICSPAFTYTPNSLNKTMPSPYLAQSTIDLASIEASVFQQINQFRISQVLPALTRNLALDNQARIHSQNMANGQIPLGHIGFTQRIQASIIPYQTAAENVAMNGGYSDPATQAVQGWLISSGHLNNIQGEYDLTGIGAAINNKGEVYLTQIFLRSPGQTFTPSSSQTTYQTATPSSSQTTYQTATPSSSQTTYQTFTPSNSQMTYQTFTPSNSQMTYQTFTPSNSQTTYTISPLSIELFVFE